MKLILATTLALLSAGVTVRAADVGDFGAMVQRNNPSCTAHSLRIDRVVAVQAACCDGARCSQMLSTTKVDRPRHSSHT